MEKKKGALYIRVSTKKDEQQSSLEIQEAALQQICDSKNIEIIDTYSDKASGTRIRKRKGFISLLYDAGIDFHIRNDKSMDDFIINKERKPKFDFIIVKDIFRFGRNSNEAMQVIKELKDNGVIVIFINAGFDTSDKDYKMRLEMLFTIAENESHNTSQRIKFSKRHLAEQGNYTPARLAYGFKRIINDNGEKEIVIDKEQAEIVRFIFEQYKENGGHKISQILNERGIPTQQGRKWSDDKIQRIVTNPVYYGSPVVQKKTKNDVTDIHFKKADESQHIQLHNAVPPIVTKEQFDELQLVKTKRTNPKSNLGQRTSKDDIFNEKVYCAKCGAKFVRHSGENKKVTYMCHTRRKFGSKECDCKGIAYNNLVKFVNECSIQKEDVARDLIYLNLIKRISEAKSELKEIEDSLNTKIDKLDNEINLITRKFVVASPEMEEELNNMMIQAKENKNKLLEQKQGLNVKMFDDLLNQVDEKNKFFTQVSKAQNHTFEDKLKMIRQINVDSHTVQVELNMYNFVDEIKLFNQLVEGTDLAFDSTMEYFKVKPFVR